MMTQMPVSHRPPCHAAIPTARRFLRPSAFSLQPSASRRSRAAFSLLELMIAIMILGIGLVMVATVFPVGIDLASDTIQRHIAGAAVEAAINTLKIKVPLAEDLDGGGGPLATRITVAQAVAGVDENGDGTIDSWHIDPDATIDQFDIEVLGGFNYRPYNDWFSTVWIPGGFTIDQDKLFKRVAVFTELSGWPAEGAGTGVNPDIFVNNVAVLPAQNLSPAYADHLKPDMTTVNDLLWSIPVMISPGYVRNGYDDDALPRLPRVSLADQVYPPVPLTTIDSSGKLVERTPSEVLNDIASRRYNWTALHHRLSSSTEQNGLLVTIVVTHRADLNARYARQDSAKDGSALFDLVGSDKDDNRHKLLKPEPDPNVDVVFPRPWLVMLREFTNDGIVRCTPEAARLLPAGSQFVIAQSQGTLVAGTSHEVKSSEWPPAFDFANGGTDESDLDGDPAELQGRIQLKQGVGNGEQDVLVWVFPPAIQRVGTTYTFSRQSPVAGVALRTIE